MEIIKPVCHLLPPAEISTFLPIPYFDQTPCQGDTAWPVSSSEEHLVISGFDHGANLSMCTKCGIWEILTQATDVDTG